MQPLIVLLITLSFSSLAAATTIDSISLGGGLCTPNAPTTLVPNFTGTFDGSETQVIRRVSDHVSLCAASPAQDGPTNCVTFCGAYNSVIPVEIAILDADNGVLASAQTILAPSYPDFSGVLEDSLLGYKAVAGTGSPNIARAYSDFEVRLNDVRLFDTEGTSPDNPETYIIKKEVGLYNVAAPTLMQLPSLFVFGDGFDLSYVKYAISESGKEIAPGNITIPKSDKHAKRLWTLTNELGSITIETLKVSALLMPVIRDELTDKTFQPAYKCYKGKFAGGTFNPNGPSQVSSAGKYIKGMQLLIKDGFNECAGSFQGSHGAVDKCVIDIGKPVEICSPVDVTEVPPPDTSSVSFTEKLVQPLPDGLKFSPLLCYQAKGNSKLIKDPTAAYFAGLPDGPVTTPPVYQHSPRSISSVSPFGFPAPTSVTTKKLEVICLPSALTSVSLLQ